MMNWTLIISVVLLGIFPWIILCNDQCETGVAPTTDETNVTCPAPGHVCPAGEIWCGSGTSCLPLAGWCNGSNECPGNADEAICTKTCSGCTALQSNTYGADAGACQPVVWVPPRVDRTNDTMISDCSHFPGTTFPPGETTTVVYTVDVNGVSANQYCKFDITVPAGPCDPPVENCPNGNVMVQANVNAETAVATWPEVTSSGNTVSINEEAYRPGSVFRIGYHYVSYTITKADGKQSFCRFYVIVEANPATPTARTCTLTPILVMLNPPATNTTVANQLNSQISREIQAAGNIKSNSTSPATTNTFPVGTTEFTLTLVDQDDNSYSCRTDVSVERPVDNVKPTITDCPSSGVTVCYKAGAQVTKGAWKEPSASDNILMESFISDVSPNNYLLIPTGSPQTTPVTYTATDWNNNVETCNFTLTFQEDALAPVLSNCKNFTEYTSSRSGSIPVSYTRPTITDNCGQYQTVTDPPENTLFAIESTTRITITATDDAENNASCSFYVEVRIDLAPVFNNCPSSWTAATDPGKTSTNVAWVAPQITDDNQLNVDKVNLTITPALPGVILRARDPQSHLLEQGVYTVVYSYTDVVPQTGICTFTITVQDSEAPTFNTSAGVSTCPSNIERSLTATKDTVEVEWTTPTATDNDGQPIEVKLQNPDYAPGSDFRAGEYIVVYNATDQAGNSGYCSFILTVNAYDTRNLWMDCPNNIEAVADAGLPYAKVDFEPPKNRSGVDRPSITYTHSPGSNFNIGDTPVTYTISDAGGNTETCTFRVTVRDEEASLLLNCPGATTAYALVGTAPVPVYWREPQTSDNSRGTVSLTAVPFSSGTELDYGSYQVYYSAVDPSGNTATGCHAQVTVLQPVGTHAVTGTAAFSSVRGVSSTNAFAQSNNLAGDLDVLFRQNTAISMDIAGVQVGFPSQLSSGLLVPFTLYFGQCRSAFLHVRDSLAQNLGGPDGNSFSLNNVVDPNTLQLNTKEFKVSLLTIDQDRRLTNGSQQLIYNSDYNDPRTSAYKALEDRLCSAMDRVFVAYTGYCGCDVWQFRSGSIITDLILIYSDNSGASAATVLAQIRNSINSADNSLDDLVLQNVPSTTVTEVCPDGYCQNGGTCEPNAATYLSQCRCTTGCTGTRCETCTTVTTPTTTAPTGSDGLSTEEIIGIVVGAVGGLLLLIILLACCCVFCLPPTQPKPQPIIQQPPGPRPPVFAVQKPRPNVMIRDVLEPPPIPRPYPVRVPMPYPVRTPVPVPVPVPKPVPRPVPYPIRQPFAVPVRVPVPVPQAVPRPVPMAIRQPMAVNNPFALAVPNALPATTPLQVPFNAGISATTPLQMPFNAGVGVNEQVPVFGVGQGVSRQPLGPGLGTGFGSRLGPNLTGFNSGLGLNNGLALNGGLSGGLNGGLNRGLNGGLNGGFNGFNNTGF